MRDRGGSEDENRLWNSKPRLFKFTLAMALNYSIVKESNADLTVGN